MYKHKYGFFSYNSITIFLDVLCTLYIALNLFNFQIVISQLHPSFFLVAFFFFSYFFINEDREPHFNFDGRRGLSTPRVLGLPGELRAPMIFLCFILLPLCHRQFRNFSYVKLLQSQIILYSDNRFSAS